MLIVDDFRCSELGRNSELRLMNSMVNFNYRCSDVLGIHGNMGKLSWPGNLIVGTLFLPYPGVALLLVEGKGVYLGHENRKTAQNFRKKRKTARKIGKNENPKIHSFLLLQLILGE